MVLLGGHVLCTGVDTNLDVESFDLLRVKFGLLDKDLKQAFSMGLESNHVIGIMVHHVDVRYVEVTGRKLRMKLDRIQSQWVVRLFALLGER